MTFKRAIFWHPEPDEAFEEEAKAYAETRGLEIRAVVFEEEVLMRHGRSELTREILNYTETLNAVNGPHTVIVTRSEPFFHAGAPWLSADLEKLGVTFETIANPPAAKPKQSKSFLGVAVSKPRDFGAKSVAQRLFEGRQAGARAGFHQSGPAPYGYERVYETVGDRRIVRLIPHEDEAPIVRTIFRQYLRLRSMKKLIAYLSAMGSRTRRRKAWSRAGVSWILKNETYLGRVHFGDIRSKGHHPPLVAPILFNKAQKLIRKNNKRNGKASKQAV